MPRGYTRYCDHHWVRDDQHTEQCARCGRYRGVDDDE
jgi:ribosomal protein S14